MEIPILASLSGWEKKLLLDFQQSFPKDVATSNSQIANDLNRIFDSWCWARKLRGDIEEVFENFPQKSQSDPSIIWELIRRWISHCDGGYACHSRVLQLLQDNEDLARQFLGLAKQFADPKLAPSIDENLSIIPGKNDRPFWDIVVDIMDSLPSPWRGLGPNESVPDRFGRYTLFSTEPTGEAKILVENLKLIVEKLKSTFVIDDTASGSSSPNVESSAPVIDDEVSEPPTGEPELSALASYYHESPLVTQTRSDTKMLLERLKDKLVTDDEAPNKNMKNMAFERVMKHLSTFSIPPPRDSDKEPRSATESSADEARSSSDTNYNILTSHYREFEIWSLTRMAGMAHRRQLRSATLAENTEPELGFILPFSMDDPTRWLEYIPVNEMTNSSKISSGSELLWKPPKQLLLDHHLFTEEEVFKYCVETDFVFPGHKNEESIVFMASELDKSSILHELDKLESLWNDCAVTVDLTDGQWYLLETIPGVKFRSIASEFGIKAARAHFRQIVDSKRLNRYLRLKEDILQDSFEPGDLSQFDRYDGLVEAIDFKEITLCNEPPLGGKSGDVWHADWNCPQKIDMSSSEKFGVVLKRIWPPGPESVESRSKNMLLRELELTLQVSVRRPSGLSALHGLIRVPSNHTLSTITARSNEVIQDSIFLVIEFARQSLFQHLGERLRGVDQDWDTIAYRFEDLAYSIGTIHQQNIVHRDIYPDNIMIREETYSKSSTVLSGDLVVIIDLGESRTLKTLSESYNPYGNADYWAPEVKLGRHMSMESDMYAIGLVMFQILELRCKIARSPVVPKPLLDAVVSCLQEKPERRPTAKQLSDNLHDINLNNHQLLESGLGQVAFKEAELVKLREADANGCSPTDSDCEEDSDSIYDY